MGFDWYENEQRRKQEKASAGYFECVGFDERAKYLVDHSEDIYFLTWQRYALKLLKEHVEN